jgi:hypothetical protein
MLALPPGLKRQKREAHHSPPSNTEDKKVEAIPFLHTSPWLSASLIKHRGNFIYTIIVENLRLKCDHVNLFDRGTRYRSWSRHYATSRKVAGLFSDEVVEFFSAHNPSSRIMALGSTQPLTEMSTRNLPEGKADNLIAICYPIF